MYSGKANPFITYVYIECNAAEFAYVRAAIDMTVKRCAQVQRQLGSHKKAFTADSSEHHNSPTWLTARSQLLFNTAPHYSTQGCKEQQKISAKQVNQQNASWDSPGEDSLMQRYRCQQHPAKWTGAVDLNPGSSFMPGPEKGGSR
jgi:hypothetical protein